VTLGDDVGHLRCFSSGDDGTRGGGGPWGGSKGDRLGSNRGEALRRR
jgi:hypothetical protein